MSLIYLEPYKDTTVKSKSFSKGRLSAVDEAAIRVMDTSMAKLLNKY